MLDLPEEDGLSEQKLDSPEGEKEGHRSFDVPDPGSRPAAFEAFDSRVARSLGLDLAAAIRAEPLVVGSLGMRRRLENHSSVFQVLLRDHDGEAGTVVERERVVRQDAERVFVGNVRLDIR